MPVPSGVPIIAFACGAGDMKFDSSVFAGFGCGVDDDDVGTWRMLCFVALMFFFSMFFVLCASFFMGVTFSLSTAARAFCCCLCFCVSAELFAWFPTTCLSRGANACLGRCCLERSDASDECGFDRDVPELANVELLAFVEDEIRVMLPFVFRGRGFVVDRGGGGGGGGGADLKTTRSPKALSHSSTPSIASSCV